MDHQCVLEILTQRTGIKSILGTRSADRDTEDQTNRGCIASRVYYGLITKVVNLDTPNSFRADL